MRASANIDRFFGAIGVSENRLSLGLSLLLSLLLISGASG